MTDFLEQTLGLPVNRDKSRVAPVKDVEFLGFQILRGQIRISTKARQRFKNRVRDLTRRNNGLSMLQIIRDLSEYLRGWVEYFRIQEFRKVFKELDSFIRGRLRSMQLKKWKKPKKLQRMMIRAGYPVGRSEADLAQDEQMAIGGTTGGAIRPQPGLVSPPYSALSRRLHATESQTGVCALIEERLTWPVRAVPTGGGGLRPASYRDLLFLFD